MVKNSPGQSGYKTLHDDTNSGKLKNASIIFR